MKLVYLVSGLISCAVYIGTVEKSSSQQIMDGSDKAIKDDDMKALRKILGRNLKDPYGSQLAELKLVAPGKLCGTINTKNSYGGLIGFRGFGANLETGVLAATPDTKVDQTSPASMQDAIDKLNAFIEICKEK